MRIQPIHLGWASDAEYAALNALRDRQELEDDSTDPPDPHAERVKRWRNLPEWLDFLA